MGMHGRFSFWGLASKRVVLLWAWRQGLRYDEEKLHASIAASGEEKVALRRVRLQMTLQRQKNGR